MKLALTRRRKIIFVGLASFIPLLIVGFYARPPQPLPANLPLIPKAVAVVVPPVVHYQLPLHLRIPSLKINAVVEHLGLTSAGAMATTASPDTVAWYKLGQRPGEVGSAVIAGHFGWKDGLPAAFDHLDQLQPGDKIYIDDEAGTSITFVVRVLKSYGQADDATSIFRSSDNLAHLNLITCEGKWNATTHSYSKRLVAFADKL